MSNVIYNYPKSFCNCYKCTEKDYKIDTETEIPTNMSVSNCQKPKLFECYDSVPFRFDIEPQYKNGIEVLNPQVAESKYPPDFEKIKCNNQQVCNQTQYASHDPRLFYAPYAQILTLDRPPLDSTSDLSDKSLYKYGQNYNGYKDIDAGQIVYYINKEKQEPFFSPLFTTPAYTYGNLYQDPMGSMKPEYKRVPLKYNNPLDTHKKTYEGGLSWIQDSTSHREDILSKQMSRNNQQRYESRWYT